jgi:hypothetical protein
MMNFMHFMAKKFVMNCCILDDKWFSPLPRFPVCPFLAIDWFYNGLTGTRANRAQPCLVLYEHEASLSA